MKRFDQPILVTRPYLPDLESFKKGCEEIWANQWLTNNGPVHRRFHSALAARLGVPATNLALFSWPSRSASRRSASRAAR